MGWVYRECDWRALVEELAGSEKTDTCAASTLAHETVYEGDQLIFWLVREYRYHADDEFSRRKAGSIARVIFCVLLDPAGDRTGYKVLDEAAHPYYYSCPLRLLDLAPVACADWREGVRCYHMDLGVEWAAMALPSVAREDL